MTVCKWATPVTLALLFSLSGCAQRRADRLAAEINRSVVLIAMSNGHPERWVEYRRPNGEVGYVYVKDGQIGGAMGIPDDELPDAIAAVAAKTHAAPPQ